MAVARVASGQTLSLRPKGNSMVPLIYSNDLVVIAPVIPDNIEPGDIVLCRVSGTVWLHKVLVVDEVKRRARIGNNHGGVNGWASFDRIYGICIEVDDRPRPRIKGKVRDDTGPKTSG